MVEYRTFRNNDPPQLAEIWNETLTNRGAVRLRHSSPLEHSVFAKSYFDPKGMQIATEDGKLVGFAHSGFGPREDQSALSYDLGITCMMAVRPTYQGRGIGTELLRRSEAYLQGRGAKILQAGAVSPVDPFYFGLYGGATMPGFLLSDTLVEPFLLKHGYKPHESRLVLNRRLKLPLSVVDARFPGLRKNYEIRIVQRSGVRTWWQECVLGPIEVVEFRMEDRNSSEPVAIASVWEMDGFSWRWNQPSVGIIDIVVKPELRRQAMAKFLLGHLLKYLQEQYFEIIEAHVSENHVAGQQLLSVLGFEQVDTGRTYRK